MDIPKAFWKICARFHQDIGLMHQTETEILDYVVRGLTGTERKQLAQFLNDAFSKADANELFVRLWKKSDADFYIVPESRTIDTFKKIRERL